MLNHRQLKIFFLGALSCFLLTVLFELNYCDKVYLLTVGKVWHSPFPVCKCPKADCFTEIIKVLKTASLNDTKEGRDLNLKALDILISTVQKFVYIQKG